MDTCYCLPALHMIDLTLMTTREIQFQKVMGAGLKLFADERTWDVRTTNRCI